MNNGNATREVYLYTRYERFWHWFQALLIIVLAATGFEIHGSFKLIGFQRAVAVHNFLGLTWLVSFAFFVFWLFTTGEWKQYIPTTKMMAQVIRYYLHGIFTGQPHPCPKSKDAKHNPVQRLTYLALAAAILPLQMASGLLYYLYNSWAEFGIKSLSLGSLALFHLVLAFGLVVFLVVHVYMTTTGHTVFAHMKAMFTGWEEVGGESAADWEKRSVKH
jgi:thiosulfate reductase cytochrome b subunit